MPCCDVALTVAYVSLLHAAVCTPLAAGAVPPAAGWALGVARHAAAMSASARGSGATQRLPCCMLLLLWAGLFCSLPAGVAWAQARPWRHCVTAHRPARLTACHAAQALLLQGWQHAPRSLADGALSAFPALYGLRLRQARAAAHPTRLLVLRADTLTTRSTLL